MAKKSNARGGGPAAPTAQIGASVDKHVERIDRAIGSVQAKLHVLEQANSEINKRLDGLEKSVGGIRA